MLDAAVCRHHAGAHALLQAVGVIAQFGAARSALTSLLLFPGFLGGGLDPLGTALLEGFFRGGSGRATAFTAAVSLAGASSALAGAFSTGRYSPAACPGAATMRVTEGGGGTSLYTMRPLASRHCHWADADAGTAARAAASSESDSEDERIMARNR